MLRSIELGSATAPDVLRALDFHTRRLGLPGPAALIGDWLGADAVIAPSITVTEGGTVPDHPDQFWFGYLGFPDRAGDGPLPAAAGGSTDAILHQDRLGTWWWTSVTGQPCPDWVRAALGENHHSDWSVHWSPPQQAPHVAAIDDCLDAIRAGEVYQACICTRFTGHVEGSVAHFYADGVDVTRPRKSAFLQGDWGSVVSFSPETYLTRHGSVVRSSPIKGTLPIDLDPRQLLDSAKDVAENIMIVDLVRNDLGRVAVPGTVTVTELLKVHPAPGVWHLVSTVQATLGQAVTNGELIDATFPPASVTGTPKIRARQLLSDWEQFPRGVYCGAIGVAAPDGDLDLNVAIRTVQVSPDGSAHLGVGGGITIDSDPASEWQECLDKAAAIIGLRPRTDQIHVDD
ncbi:UNVERIFIED_CONTAM: para-aminobenzoate synthetase component 1 [Williamsia faeni]